MTAALDHAMPDCTIYVKSTTISGNSEKVLHIQTLSPACRNCNILGVKLRESMVYLRRQARQGSAMYMSYVISVTLC